jgi:hypothetical protein
MAVYAMTQVHVASNELEIGGFANQVELAMEAEELDVTTLGSGGYRRKILGLGSFSTNISGFQDYVAPSPASVKQGPESFGTLDTFTVSIPGTTVGDVAHFGQTRSTQITDLAGDVGQPATFTHAAVGTSRVVRGIMLHPVAARTATGNGTVTALAGPTATQALHASFHVHSVTGSGTITFVVATDDTVGFASPVTRITSQGFTAVGHQFASVAGAFAGETHVRVQWTISGFSSCTFSVAAGVGAP